MKINRKIIVLLCALFIFGCSQPQTKSPTEVLKTLNEASKIKDVAAIKNSVSKGTLDLMKESAKAQKTTIDELLKKDNGAPFNDLPEMRNEKIEGDAATIELKNTTTDGWETVPFVKEDGVWRLALDKYLDDFKKKTAASMKTPAPVENNSESNASRANGDKKPKDAENKLAKGKN